jgi:type IV secretory pathway TrbD component
MRLARGILIGVGVLGLLLGAVVLVSKQDLPAILGLAAWMLGAIILHDAVISPLVFLVGVLARRAGRRVSRGLLLIIQGGIVIGCLLMLLVVPEIYAKTLGTANDTVLPFDYAARLGLMWLGMLVLTALVAGIYLRRVHRTGSSIG